MWKDDEDEEDWFGEINQRTQAIVKLILESILEEKILEELLEWERVYNTIKPHRALGYLVPLKLLCPRTEYSAKKVMCH